MVSTVARRLLPRQNEQPSDRRQAYEQRMGSGALALPTAEVTTEYWIGDSFGVVGASTPGATDMVSLYEAIMARNYNSNPRASGFQPVEPYFALGTYATPWSTLPAIGVNSDRVQFRGVQNMNRWIKNTGTVAGTSGTGSGITIYFTAEAVATGALVDVAINGVAVGTVDSRDASLAGAARSSGRRSVYFARPGTGGIGTLTVTLTVNAATPAGTFEIEGGYWHANNQTAGHQVIRGDKAGQSISYLVGAPVSLGQVISNVQPKVVTICLGVNDANPAGAYVLSASAMAAAFVTLVADIRGAYPTGDAGGWDDNPTRQPMLPDVRYVFQHGSVFVPAGWVTEYRAAMIRACVDNDVLFVDGQDLLGSTTAVTVTAIAAGSNGVNVSTFVGAQDCFMATGDLLASGYVGITTVDGTAMVAYTAKVAGKIQNCTTLSSTGAGVLTTGDVVERSGDPVDFTSDGLHPNDRGHRAYAQMVVNVTARAGTRSVPFALSNPAAQSVGALLGVLSLKAATGVGLNLIKDSGAALVAADQLSILTFQGSVDAFGNYAPGVSVRALAEGTFTPTSSPTGYEVMTTPTGTIVPVTRQGIDRNGLLWVGLSVAAAVATVDQTGVAVLAGRLSVGSTALPAPVNTANFYEYGATVPALGLYHALGTVGAPTAITNFSVVGRLNFKGYDSASFITGARIDVIALENWAVGATGDSLQVWTTPPTTSVAVDRLTVSGLPYVSARGAVVATGDTGASPVQTLAGAGLDIQAGFVQFRQSVLTLPNTAGLNSNLTLPLSSYAIIPTAGITGNFSIGGFVVPTPRNMAGGMRLWIEAQNTTYSFTIVHEDAGSTAAQRITTPQAANLVGLRAVLLQYDSVLTRWRVISFFRAEQVGKNLTNAWGTIGTGAQTPDPTLGDFLTGTLSGNVTLNAGSVLPAGSIWTFQILSDASARVVTWGTSFKAVGGTFTSTISKSFTFVFRSDGTSWFEIARSSNL